MFLSIEEVGVVDDRSYRVEQIRHPDDKRREPDTGPSEDGRAVSSVIVARNLPVRNANILDMPLT